MNRIDLFIICALLSCSAAASETVSLERAMELALEHSPRLRAARLDTEAAEQAVRATGRWSNPFLKLEAEGVGGDLDGFSDTEYTVELMQTFSRGGKRGYERAVAEEAVNSILHAAQEKERELLAEIRRIFIEGLYQQEVGKVRAAQEQLGRAFVQAAQARYNAGGGSQMEVIQAELQLEEILLAQNCCFGERQAARRRLASLIGLDEAAMGELSGNYYELPNSDTAELIAQHPTLQRLNADVSVMEARAKQAAATDTSDINLGVGYRYEAASDINSFIFEAGMPLGIVRKGADLQVALLMQADALRAERDAFHQKVNRELSAWTALLDGSKLEARQTRERLLPKAEEAYELTRTGYEAGRFSWMELISAQQHLTEIQLREVEALKEAHLAYATISTWTEER